MRRTGFKTGSLFNFQKALPGLLKALLKSTDCPQTSERHYTDSDKKRKELVGIKTGPSLVTAAGRILTLT